MFFARVILSDRTYAVGHPPTVLFKRPRTSCHLYELRSDMVNSLFAFGRAVLSLFLVPHVR